MASTRFRTERVSVFNPSADKYVRYTHIYIYTYIHNQTQISHTHTHNPTQTHTHTHTHTFTIQLKFHTHNRYTLKVVTHTTGMLLKRGEKKRWLTGKRPWETRCVRVDPFLNRRGRRSWRMQWARDASSKFVTKIEDLSKYNARSFFNRITLFFHYKYLTRTPTLEHETGTCL